MWEVGCPATRLISLRGTSSLPDVMSLISCGFRYLHGTRFNLTFPPHPLPPPPPCRELTLPIAERLGIPLDRVFANRMLWQVWPRVLG